MFLRSTIYNIVEKQIHDMNEVVNANIIDRCAIMAKQKRNMRFIPSSAGTTATACDAN